MDKQELIEKINTRIEFAEGDIATAVYGVDSDIAIIKKIFLCQILDLVKLLDEPPTKPCKWCLLMTEIYSATTDKTALSPMNYCNNCGRKLKG